jgi:RND family efflux transporter MFP subunit
MTTPELNAVPVSGKRRKWPLAVAVLAVLIAGGGWWWATTATNKDAQAARRPAGAVTVITTTVEKRDVPVRIKTNGTVTSLQSVDLRAQVTSTIAHVHIREGQSVAKGDLLFSLDSRAEEANLKKAQAQVEKDKADLATAARNLERQRELFRQKFISQAALDTAENQVDTLKGQLAVDTAAVEGMRVARAYAEIRAPFAGRTGVIGVRDGSLVQPSQSSATTAPPLVTITQIDPIGVSFTLPEKELAGLQQTLRAGPMMVTATPPGAAPSGTGSDSAIKGKITFVDNAVDTATGTIRVKAEFSNTNGALWPGMYVPVEVSTRVITAATVVPAQALQTGPDNRFIYEVGPDKKVQQRPVTLTYLDEGLAVVSGVAPGARIVVEGAQNLRPGSQVAEATPAGASPRAPATAGDGPGPKSKGKKS